MLHIQDIPLTYHCPTNYDGTIFTVKVTDVIMTTMKTSLCTSTY